MLISKSNNMAAMTMVFAALLFSAGCASKGGAAPEQGAAPKSAVKSGKSIGEVSVNLDTSALAEDVVPVAEQYSVTDKLDTDLRGRKQFGGGELTLDISVVSMRLRTKGAAVAGLSTGVDWLAAKVAVMENGAVVNEFEEKSTSSAGGFFFIGREKRLDRMIKDLGNRIVKRL